MLTIKSILELCQFFTDESLGVTAEFTEVVKTNYGVQTFSFFIKWKHKSTLTHGPIYCEEALL